MSTVTISGKLVNAIDGTPHTGYGWIEPTVPVVLDSTADKVYVVGKKFTLDATGSFAVVVRATDDPLLNPQNFTYRLRFRVSGVEMDDIYFLAPAANPIIDLTDIAPVESSTGVPYVVGPAGAAGPAGATGANGIAGASAYEVAVVNGFVGTEAEWLASLVGPQGPAGASATSPKVFFSISMQDQTTVTIPKGTFSAIPYIAGATITNIGGGTWNPTTFGFTIPVSGLYDCLGVVRRADGDNIGTWYTNQSIGKVIADVPESVWSGDISQSRWAMPYARFANFTAGDVIYHVFRASGGGTATNFTVKAASLTIGLVRAD